MQSISMRNLPMIIDLYYKKNGVSSWFSFTVILSNKTKLRPKIIKALKMNNIEFRIITGKLFKTQGKKIFDFTAPNGVKNANYAHDFGFFVGNYPYDLKKKLIICTRFSKAYNG